MLQFFSIISLVAIGLIIFIILLTYYIEDVESRMSKALFKIFAGCIIYCILYSVVLSVLAVIGKLLIK